MEKLLITKADGELEPFDPAKLEQSLEHAGASSTMRAKVVARVIEQLHPGIMTEDIYRRAFEMLREDAQLPVAARYSMKRAVFALGPSGYPFESFLAEVFRGIGWSVQTEVVLMGRCAPHEVDVLAEKDGERLGIEAKFHNDPGGKTDIKDALYVKARYDDLKLSPEAFSRVESGCLITNTRFTRNAIRYAQCSNLRLIGWDYPRTRGLMTLIEEAKVHPITALTTLTDGEKRHLLERKIVLCKSVQTPHLLQEYGVKPDRIPRVTEEARRLCGI
ncbi:MAG TPA: restriction endonuclease [Candidatus Paceibacterota bacterium]|nr:restriction endonuclease [Candidatus Paceibacterota bacterium]